MSSKHAAQLTVLNTLRKSITPQSSWTDKDEFLDVIYWMRQIVGLITGIFWGLLPLRGATAISLFFIVNCSAVYLYSSVFQRIDEEEHGGYGEILKEGLMTTFATFMIVWIVFFDRFYGPVF
ncbi:unnamed protein product [Mesocestoides corti]|uniref:Rab5-interacting protein n=1 Tax=Mesocestoides corti TaxID=53468 RepID=A0A0R3UF95_MESCO|nr:unnamed protein product [Mesocestoides corti]